MSSPDTFDPNERQPQAHGLRARTIALNLFQEVQTQRLSLDDVIAASKSYKELDARDRGFVRHLLASTLRHLGQIDTLIKQFLSRNRRLCRIGTCILGN